MPAKAKKDSVKVIRYVYLYLVTAITIVLILISTIGLVHLVLDEFVFDVKSWEELEDVYYECEDGTRAGISVEKPVAVTEEPVEGSIMTDAEKEECEAEARERREIRHMNDVKQDLVTWLSMLLVSLPIYFVHWGIIKKEGRKK